MNHADQKGAGETRTKLPVSVANGGEFHYSLFSPFGIL